MKKWCKPAVIESSPGPAILAPQLTLSAFSQPKNCSPSAERFSRRGEDAVEVLSIEFAKARRVRSGPNLSQIAKSLITGMPVAPNSG
jgi:hypothetical protein